MDKAVAEVASLRDDLLAAEKDVAALQEQVHAQQVKVDAQVGKSAELSAALHESRAQLDIAEERRKQLEKQVANQQPGMTPDQLNRLYQPFERLGRETSHVEGTGLGLIITRSLIESMGGRMEIESRPGSGTRVSIPLPQATSAMAATDGAQANDGSPKAGTIPTELTASPPSPASDSQRPLRVLYVEDNPMNGEMVSEYLEVFENIRTEVVPSLSTARAALASGLPSVLLLDVNLPDGSGAELASEAARRYPELPVVLVTADVVAASDLQAMMPSLAGVLVKPVCLHELFSVIRVHLDPR